MSDGGTQNTQRNDSRSGSLDDFGGPVETAGTVGDMTTDLMTTGIQRATLVTQLRDPEITLPRAVAVYLLHKRKQLSEESERGYTAILDLLTKTHPGLKLSDLEPPDGNLILEEFLAEHWAARAPRTYNKSRSVLSDFTKWHVNRGSLKRDAMASVDRAKPRPIHRRVFTDVEVVQILSSNTDPRDQAALRLLLFFGIRKGALRRIRFEHFSRDTRELTIFTKGGVIQTLEIVDQTVWDLLDELREPPHHYLLPKRTTRLRTSPHKKALAEIGRALADGRASLNVASADEQCGRELAMLLDTLDVADARHALATSVASTQARVEFDQPIGQHGAHLWWYRCLARAGVVADGVTAGRRLHLARHTAIQRVLDVTGNMRMAQELAGHSSMAITGDNYTDVTPKQLGQTMRTVLA